MRSKTLGICGFSWLLFFPILLPIASGKASRMDILQSVLERTQGDAKVKAWILLSYTASQTKDAILWKMLESSFGDRETFDAILKREYHFSKDLIEELIYDSTINESIDDIHLLFDKAYGRMTKHLLGTKLPLLLPESYSLADATRMIKQVKFLSSRAPLVEVSNELGRWGSDLLDSYHMKEKGIAVIKQTIVAAGTIGASYAAGQVGMVVCGPLCAAGAAAGAYFFASGTLESFTKWFTKFLALRHSDALQEAYAFFVLSEDSTNAEIRKAWRLKAAKLHPDNGGDQYEFAKASLKIMLIKKHRMGKK